MLPKADSYRSIIALYFKYYNAKTGPNALLFFSMRGTGLRQSKQTCEALQLIDVCKRVALITCSTGFLRYLSYCVRF